MSAVYSSATFPLKLQKILWTNGAMNFSGYRFDGVLELG